MFVKIFDTNNPFILIIIFVIGILFWISVFVSPYPIPNPSDTIPLFKSIFFILNGHNLLDAILAYLLVFTEGVIITYIINRDKLFSSNSFLPAMVFILLMSSLKHLETITPALVAILFLILAINQIFYIYEEEKAFSQIFKLGFFISVASLCYIPSLFVIVLVFVSFIIFKIFKWREWFIFFIGLITPYLYTAFYWFWKDKLTVIITEYSVYFNSHNFSIHKFSTNIYIFIIITGILILLSISNLLNVVREKLIKIRLSYYVIIWFLIISLFFVFFGKIKQAYFFEFTFIPLSIILSNYIQNLKKGYMRDIIFVIIILIIITSRFIF